MENVKEFLATIPLFTTFSTKELSKLIEQSQLKIYSPNEVIIELGQQGRFLGVLLSGEAEAAVTERPGDRRHLGRI